MFQNHLQEKEVGTIGSTTLKAQRLLPSGMQEDKLLWLQVRMTGREQKSYKNLSGEAKSRYELCKKGLQEPGSRKELYLFELHARTKRKTEDWPSFAEDIKSLAECAFANFEETAEEHQTLTHYRQLDNLQVAEAVKNS